jgi:osmoprotectant transport system substrate-binding protein
VRKLVLVAACLALVACEGSNPAPGHAGGSTGTVVVGVSGSFAENELVAEMYAQVLEHAGYRVERRFDLRSREISQNALESGQIDLKPEYLSSLLLFLDPNAVASDDPVTVNRQDRDLLLPRGITSLTPAPAEDTNAFVVTSETAQRFDLATVSSLAPVADQLTFGGPPECAQRPFCLPGLNRVYGILFNDFAALDAGGPQTIAALKSDAVQVGLLFSTDPRIGENGFVALADDEHLQDAENITPVIRRDVLTAEIGRLLDAVSARLTTEDVTKLVGDVVIDGEDVPTVARRFLTENGLL